MRIPTGGVGFFDSGVGGLTVLHACLPFLKDVPIYYYGDNARAPYGGKSKEEIRAFTLEAFETFRALNVQAVVAACNTVTSVCIGELRNRYGFPVVGTEPAILPAAKRGGKVFVLATRATVQSNRFNNLYARAKKRYPQTEFSVFACEGLAAAVEQGVKTGDFSEAERYLPDGSPDSVVLGCTHYAYLHSLIKARYGCSVYDSGEGVANRLHSILVTLNGAKSVAEIPLPSEWGRYAVVYERTNVCLSKNGEIASKIPENNDFFDVFYLGSGKKSNKNAYEQMFVYPKGANLGLLWSIFPKK